MATAIRTKEILDGIAQRVRDVHAEPGGATFGFKLIQSGGLELLAAREDLTQDLPALIIVPDRTLEILPRTASADAFEFEHFARALFLQKFDASANVEALFWSKVDSLAQTFLDETTLGGLVLTNAQIAWGLTHAVDFRPEEREVLAANGKNDIFIAAVIVRTRVWTQK